MNDIQILIEGLYALTPAIKALEKYKKLELKFESKSPIKDYIGQIFIPRNNAVIADYNKCTDILRKVRAEKEKTVAYIIDAINDEEAFLQALEEAKINVQMFTDNYGDKNDYDVMNESYSLYSTLDDSEKRALYEAYHNYLDEKSSHLK